MTPKDASCETRKTCQQFAPHDRNRLVEANSHGIKPLDSSVHEKTKAVGDSKGVKNIHSDGRERYEGKRPFSVNKHVERGRWRDGVMLSAKSCQALLDRMDHSPPASSVHGILQARILEWVAIPSSRGLNPSPLSLLHWQVGSLPPTHLGSTYSVNHGKIKVHVYENTHQRFYLISSE